MSFYDYDDYREPSEAEIIVHEAEQKLKELINPNVQESIKELQSEISELKSNNAKLENDKYSLNRKLSEIKREHEKEIELIKKNIHQKISETLHKTYWCIESSQTKLEPVQIKTEDDNIIIEVNRSKREYLVSELSKMYIEKVTISEKDDLILTWNDDDDWYSAKTIKIHEAFEVDKLLTGWKFKNCFTRKEDAQSYADYLNEKEEISEYKEIKEVESE